MYNSVSTSQTQDYSQKYPRYYCKNQSFHDYISERKGHSCKCRNPKCSFACRENWARKQSSCLTRLLKSLKFQNKIFYHGCLKLGQNATPDLHKQVKRKFLDRLNYARKSLKLETAPILECINFSEKVILEIYCQVEITDPKNVHWDFIAYSNLPSEKVCQVIRQAWKKSGGDHCSCVPIDDDYMRVAKYTVKAERPTHEQPKYLLRVGIGINQDWYSRGFWQGKTIKQIWKEIVSPSPPPPPDPLMEGCWGISKEGKYLFNRQDNLPEGGIYVPSFEPSPRPTDDDSDDPIRQVAPIHFTEKPTPKLSPLDELEASDPEFFRELQEASIPPIGTFEYYWSLIPDADPSVTGHPHFDPLVYEWWLARNDYTLAKHISWKLPVSEQDALPLLDLTERWGRLDMMKMKRLLQTIPCITQTQTDDGRYYQPASHCDVYGLLKQAFAKQCQAIQTEMEEHVSRKDTIISNDTVGRGLCLAQIRATRLGSGCRNAHVFTRYILPLGGVSPLKIRAIRCRAEVARQNP